MKNESSIHLVRNLLFYLLALVKLSISSRHSTAIYRHSSSRSYTSYRASQHNHFHHPTCLLKRHTPTLSYASRFGAISSTHIRRSRYQSALALGHYANCCSTLTTGKTVTNQSYGLICCSVCIGSIVPEELRAKQRLQDRRSPSEMNSQDLATACGARVICVLRRHRNI